MARLSLFARRRRRQLVAVYPDGVRFVFVKVGKAWCYHPRGSAAAPLAVAKAEAREEGAAIVTELV